MLLELARFESDEAARRNSDRPEQSKWREETSRFFTREAAFHDSQNVIVDVIGDPGSAGFVQVMDRNSDPGVSGN